MPKESFAKNRLKSIGFAFKGLFLLIRTEASIKIQFFIALLVTALGFYLEISITEWCIQCLAIGMVMAVEGMNTGIEKLSDFVQPNFDENRHRRTVDLRSQTSIDSHLQYQSYTEFVNLFPLTHFNGQET